MAMQDATTVCIP